MINSSGSSPGDGGTSGALTPVPALPEIEPFVAAKAEEPAIPRGFRARLLDYSAHAAMIVGLIGFAWTVGDHVVHRPALPDAPAMAASAVTSPDPLGELRERNRVLASTVQTLQTRLDVLQAGAAEHAVVAAQVHALQTNLDGLKTGLGTARSEQTAAVARLDGKIDKLAHEPVSKIQQLVERLGKLEHANVDIAPTASLPRAPDPETKSADARPTVSRPLPRPADLKTEAAIDGKTSDRSSETRNFDLRNGGDAAPTKPPVLASWVVRDVYQGVALIEGRRGTLEVVPGVSIPGAGVVKSIDRHGRGWTVTTTKGLMASAAPVRDNRRTDRGSYGYGAPGYGYDF